MHESGPIGTAAPPLPVRLIYSKSPSSAQPSACNVTFALVVVVPARTTNVATLYFHQYRNVSTSRSTCVLRRGDFYVSLQLSEYIATHAEVQAPKGCSE
jgi:hypothetical protein